MTGRGGFAGKNLSNETTHIPGNNDRGKHGGRSGHGGLFTPQANSKRGSNVISPLEGVLPKTRSLLDRDRKLLSLNQLLEPIDLGSEGLSGR